MISYNNILIMGYGKSGQAVERYLQRFDISYSIYDASVRSNGKFVNKISKRFIKKFDLIIVSPGISIFNKYIQFAINQGIKVISELEFAFLLLNKKTRLIAVTGTNGKTTTTSLLNECLKVNGFKSEAVGNIGKPLTDYADKDYDFLVCEVSSFQLELIEKFRPEIAIILNIAEDHTDRHKTFENYVNCKFNILKNNPEFAVLNKDDKLIYEKAKLEKCNKKYFSLVSSRADIFIDLKNNITLKTLGKKEKLFNFTNLQIAPLFLPDVLAVLLVIDILKLEKQLIIEALKKFDNLSHRFEILPNKQHITIINDSKATNIHAMQAALAICKNPTILLLGGTDKKLDFEDFFVNISTYNLKNIICFGEAGKRIFKEGKRYGFKNSFIVPKLKDAICLAIKLLEKDDIILFSPACSSFDEFSGYQERGDYFKKVIYTEIGKVFNEGK